MRRRLRKFLPIVLIALMVQILAPIGACWAASFAASDPLGLTTICSSGAASASDKSDQTGKHHAHDGACSMCCAAQANASVDTPQPSFTTPYRRVLRVVWLDHAPDLFGSRTGSQAQARAPPSIS
jgi:Protein of unknown function (DUF2946)